jgi:hypothetical protein
MKTIISVQPSSEMDIYILEVIDLYDYSDDNQYVNSYDILTIDDLFEVSENWKEELCTPFSATFYLNMN